MKPYSIQKGVSTLPVLITCEHASKVIPKSFKNLGLTKAEMREIEGYLYDKGALDVAKKVSNRIKADLLYSTYSRIVVDVNRPLGKSHVKNPDIDHAVRRRLRLKNKSYLEIPGNRISDKQAVERWRRHSKPYQEIGLRMAKNIARKSGRALIVPIHSFTAEKSKVDIDIIVGKSKKIAREIYKLLKRKTKYNIAINKPWSFYQGGGGAFAKTEKEKNIDLVCFEINDRNINTERQKSEIASIISEAIKNVLAK